MKTNLSNLMQIVSEEEKKFTNYGYNLRSYAYNTSIQELDGKINITEDYKQDFENVYESPIQMLFKIASANFIEKLISSKYRLNSKSGIPIGNITFYKLEWRKT